MLQTESEDGGGGVFLRVSGEPLIDRSVGEKEFGRLRLRNFVRSEAGECSEGSVELGEPIAAQFNENTHVAGARVAVAARGLVTRGAASQDNIVVPH